MKRITVVFQFFDIIFGQQAGISHDDRFGKIIFFADSLQDGQKSVPLESIAFENIITDGIAVFRPLAGQS